MTNGDPSQKYLHDYSGIEAVLKGINGIDDPQLLELLKERCGVDLKHPQRQYSQDLGDEFLNTVREYRFPNLERREGMIALGRATALGYTQTLIGQVMAAPLKVITLDRALHLLVRMLGSSVHFGQRTLQKIAEHEYVMQFRDDPRNQAFIEGIIRQFLDGYNLPGATIEVQPVGHYAFDIKVRW